MQIAALIAPRCQKPELVAFQRAAERTVEIVNLIHGRLARQIAGLQSVGNVAADETGTDIRQEHVRMELIAAVLGDHVHQNPAGLHIRAHVVSLISGFLNNLVVDIGLNLSVVLRGVDEHTIENVTGIVRSVAMRGNIGLLHLHRSAHVRRVEVDARHVGTDRLGVARGGQRVHILTREHGRAGGVFHVDGGDRSRDLNRLADRAHPHFGVHGHSDVGGDFHLAAHAGKTLQAEGNGVAAGTHVDNGVTAFIIGGDSADPFNQRGAGGFHAHTGHYCSAGIAHHAGD